MSEQEVKAETELPMALGNFEAVYERCENDNFHTSIYERDYDGLLICRCNQNGAYPWQVRVLLEGLNAKAATISSLTGDA